MTPLLQRALQHYQRGQDEAALRCCRQLLRRRPTHFDALHLQGLLLDRLGRRDDAIKALRRAARLNPGHAELWSNLGALLLDHGELEDARQALQRALELDPEHPRARYNLANLLARQEAREAAIAHYRHLLQHHPEHPRAHNNLGALLLRDPATRDEAEPHLQRAVALAPDYAEAWSNLGELYASRGQYEQARHALQRALQLAPEDPIAQFWMGYSHVQEERWDEAVPFLEACLARAPEHPDARRNLALAHLQRGEPEAAAPHIQTLLEADPEDADAWNLRGLLEQERLDWAGAEAAYRRALQLDPEHPDAGNNLGLALYHQCRWDEAEAQLRRVLQRDPDHPEAANNLALVLLGRGQLEAGFRHYRARSSLAANGAPPAPERLPDDLGGQHLLLIKDQGIGDELFFLRYLPRLLQRRPARLTLHASDKLAPLLRRRLPQVQVITGEAERPEADLSLSVGDLPLLLGVTPIPPPLPLPADAPLRQQLAQQLAHLGPPPYLGLTWRAGPLGIARRTATLRKAVVLEPLAEAVAPWPGTLLALQRRPADGELARLSDALGRPVYDLTTLNDDLEVMLAVLDLLDDYVAVSNTNVHLRASLGKTSRVLVATPPEWRWTDRDPSPWYPDHPLYRQRPDGDWRPALERLKTDLERAR